MKTAPPIRVVEGIRFLAITEVQRLTGLGRRAVLQGIETGALPAKKLGGAWYTTDLWLEVWTTTPSLPRDSDPVDLQIRIAWQRVKARLANARATPTTEPT